MIFVTLNGITKIFSRIFLVTQGKNEEISLCKSFITKYLFLEQNSRNHESFCHESLELNGIGS